MMLADVESEMQHDSRPTRSRVLIIHRDPEMCRQLEKNLSSGCEVYRAQGRTDGLPLMYKVQPDIIFLEVAPDGDEGWETFFRIRMFTDTPTILLAQQLPPPAYQSQCNYNALVLLEPISATKAAAIARALAQI